VKEATKNIDFFIKDVDPIYVQSKERKERKEWKELKLNKE